MARSNSTPRPSTASRTNTGRRDYWERLEPLQTYASPSEVEHIQQEVLIYDDRDEHGTIHAQIVRDRRKITLTWGELDDMDEFIADLQDARAKLD